MSELGIQVGKTTFSLQCKYIDHFHNDVTHSALFAHLFLLAEGIHVIHCITEKRAVGDMPVSCCTVTAQTASRKMLALDLLPFQLNRGDVKCA